MVGMEICWIRHEKQIGQAEIEIGLLQCRSDVCNNPFMGDR